MHSVTLLYNARRIVRHDLHLVKPCCLSLITSLPSLCLEMSFRRICSMFLLGTEVRLTAC